MGLIVWRLSVCLAGWQKKPKGSLAIGSDKWWNGMNPKYLPTVMKYSSKTQPNHEEWMSGGRYDCGKWQIIHKSGITKRKKVPTLLQCIASRKCIYKEMVEEALLLLLDTTISNSLLSFCSCPPPPPPLISPVADVSFSSISVVYLPFL